MSSKSLFRTLVAALPLVLLSAALPGCPEPPPPVEPKPEPPPPPPPKPKPKCKTLEEACAAKATTGAKIPGTSFVFAPPAGWIYAQGEDGTITQMDDTGPVMLVASVETTSDADQARKRREEKLEALLALAGVTPPGGKNPTLKPVPKPEAIEGTELKGLYWQFPLPGQTATAKRADKGGDLFVFVVPVAEQEIIGLGYVPKTDETQADVAIMQSLGSIEKKDDGKDSDK